MEAATQPKTARPSLEQSDAIKLWSEIEDLLKVETASLRADRMGFMQAQEWERKEGDRFYEIVVAGTVDGPTLARIQAAAASYGREVELASGCLTIR